MARTSEPTTSTSGPTPPSAAAALSSSRVTKTRSERASTRKTRQSSRSTVHLQNMVSDAQNGVVRESAHHYDPTPGVAGKGKGKAKFTQEPADVAMEGLQDMPAPTEADDAGSYMDNTDKPFPIMELPTEIRLEIYRACLTRPYNILLSKREQPPQTDPDDADTANVLSDSQSDADDTDDDTQLRTITPRPSTTTSSSSTSLRRSTIARGSASRSSRPIRLLSSRPATGSSANNSGSGSGSNTAQSATIASTPAVSTNNNSNSNSNSNVVFRSTTSRPARRNGNNRSVLLTVTEPFRNQSEDPLIVNILRASKEIYKEARSVLYSENFFTLDLNTAMGTLACLHQRSRRQIKHVELEIPTYNEILERFQETVRLSLRYCSGLKKFVIDMPFTLPGADGSGTTGNTTVYANGFDILRWLPQECGILLKGNTCIEIETVVNKHLHLAKTLDKVSYIRNQHIPFYFKEVNQRKESSRITTSSP